MHELRMGDINWMIFTIVIDTCIETSKIAPTLSTVQIHWSAIKIRRPHQLRSLLRSALQQAALQQSLVHFHEEQLPSSQDIHCKVSHDSSIMWAMTAQKHPKSSRFGKWHLDSFLGPCFSFCLSSSCGLVDRLYLHQENKTITQK